eukprot:TRINITY_DN27451_c0_g2_i1.p1 TRINITY_DN27451_c0_g2~~TRINITY_DN27451_c0_g2_i1.p1  ORF type:complete len:328 (-),score=42.62 TRINITY_DN27451_c0_g2_i1:561-1511(-)
MTGDASAFPLRRAAELACSCFTGAAVIIITNPLDCLKVRWQIEKPGGASLMSFARDIIRAEGLLAGLWKPGVVSNACACTVSVGTRLGIYPVLRDALQAQQSQQTQKSGAGMFMSGLLGGALGYTMGQPLFYATRVAQAEAGVLSPEGDVYATGARKGKPPTVPGASNSGLPMLRHLLARDGLVGLWRGSEVLIARGALMSATQLATYDLAKHRLRSLQFDDGPVMHCIASLAASLSLTTAICPLDVTYTAYLAGPAVGQTYPNAFACARSLVSQGGPLALMRGWVPLWARFLPSSVLTFVIFEQSRRLLIGNYLD